MLDIIQSNRYQLQNEISVSEDFNICLQIYFTGLKTETVAVNSGKMRLNISSSELPFTESCARTSEKKQNKKCYQSRAY